MARWVANHPWFCRLFILHLSPSRLCARGTGPVLCWGSCPCQRHWVMILYTYPSLCLPLSAISLHLASYVCVYTHITPVHTYYCTQMRIYVYVHISIHTCMCTYLYVHTRSPFLFRHPPEAWNEKLTSALLSLPSPSASLSHPPPAESPVPVNVTGLLPHVTCKGRTRPRVVARALGLR